MTKEEAIEIFETERKNLTSPPTWMEYKDVCEWIEAIDWALLALKENKGE